METQLFQACTDGDLSIVEDFITKHGLNPNEVRESSGLTPLHLACKHGHLDITQYLISEQNCNPETTTPNGRTPLHLACKSGHLHIARCLITEHKCNPHCTDNDGYTPLHAASESGNLDSDYLITENGCDPEVSDSVGNTPLRIHYASKSGHLNIVQCLITDYHCDPLKPNSRGSIPLHYASLGGALPVVKYLVSEHHCSPDHTNMFGNTPVHLACLSGHLATVKYLTNECKCNPQIVNNDGVTPLHFACLNGHLDTVKFLLSQYNCNPQCCANNGNSTLLCACQNGHLELAKYLVNEHKSSPEHGNVNGYTPLHSAASNGHLAVVKYLITELGCNPQICDNDGLTPLHYATLEGHYDIVKFLISDCNCDPQCCTNRGFTPLHHACENGHLEIAKYLITEFNCNPEPEIVFQYTPLHSAAGNGHLAVVEYLIGELGCNPQIPDKDHTTPLHYASADGHLNIMRYLFSEHNCNLQCVDNYGITPLHLACINGHLDVVKYLIQEQNCPCDPECSFNKELFKNTLNQFGLSQAAPLLDIVWRYQIIGTEGFTPLHFACMKGNTDIAKYLTNNCNCNLFHSTNGGFTPFDIAQMLGHLEIVQLASNVPVSGVSTLFKAIAQEMIGSVDPPNICASFDFTPLHWACFAGNLEAVKLYINQFNMDPSSTVVQLVTPLQLACGMGHLEIAKHLITECKCDPMCVDQEGRTPLHNACTMGQLETVKYLITQCKCDPNCVTNDGITPLHFACTMGQLETVKYLITQCKSDPNCVTNDGITPLHSACTMGQLETVKYLITQCKSDPMHVTKNGNTSLHCACQNGHLKLAKYLVNEHKCSAEHGNVNGYTPLHSAASKGHLTVVKYLITERGCNPQNHDNNGLTPLHYATLNGHHEIIKFLISDCNCDLQCRTNEGFTPLHFACVNGHLEVARYLVNEHKSSPERCNINGYSPLHSAASNGHLTVVKYLASKTGCNPQVGDGNGLTPLHAASSRGHLEIVKYLITECDCNPNSCDNFGFTPLGHAFDNKHHEILQYLMDECKCNTAMSIKMKTVYDAIQQECGKWSLPDFSEEICESTDFNVTPLQMACIRGDLETVMVLWNYNPDFQALFAACVAGKVNIVKYLIKHMIPQCSEDLSLLLFTSCSRGHLDIVKFLIEEYGCDPHSTDDDGLTPLHGTCTDATYLLINFICQNIESNTSSTVANIKVQGMLYHLWQTISYLLSQFFCRFKNVATAPGVSNSDVSHTLRTEHNSTFQLELKSDNFNVFKYLTFKHNCNAQCKDKDGLTPLHYACASGQLNIVQYLHVEKLSDLVHTTHSGDTPLHIACKYSQVEITEFLLSTGQCDPLCKNAEGMTPIEKATSGEIRELLDHFCNGNYPLESVVKVFILGDPLAGKSSMVQALQSNPGFIDSLIGRFQKVKAVRQQTAGIDSISLRSNDFGNVVIYDFAGQREFYTSHAAFLQNSSSQLAGIFIVVINIAQCENVICHSLQYWVSFILECCAHSEVKPRIIFVGSHADKLNRGDIDQIHSLVDKAVFRKSEGNQLYEPKDIVYLDCTRPVSPGLDQLRYNLDESCNSIREHAERIDQRCYVLHRYVWKVYTSAGVQGHTLESISKGLEGNSHFLPNNPTELLPLFQTLHDKGQVLLLRNSQNPGNSWVITDIAAMLETVIGSIFAPRDFPSHVSLSSTGVVSKSRIGEFFPDNTDMVIGFLEHFEFCHRVERGWIDLSELENADGVCYLFPALVTSKRPLHESQKSSYCCGWLLHPVEHQFFTTRFLHVILLRLAFLFSQSKDDSTISSTKTEGPAVKRRCKIWKNGITWHDANGVSTFFEVQDLKAVVLSMTCMDHSRIHCVRLRSQLIQTILKSQREFCPRVFTEEFIVEVANDSPLQVTNECPSYSINYISSRISKRSANDNPDMTLLLNPDGHEGPGKQISKLLYFEPYVLLTSDLIGKLFAKETAKQSVSDDFITELAQWLYPFHDALVRVLKPSSSELNKKYKDICGSLDEVPKQQLMCEHIIKTWVEQQRKSATYRNLRRQLDGYSIFCGRSPLNLVCTYNAS